MSSGEPALIALGARQVARGIRDGKIVSAEVVEACLARVRALDGRVSAWAHLDEAGARAAAQARDAEVKRGEIRGPLHGVPVGIKDIIHVAGMPTTAGAKAWAHTRPSADAPVVRRLRAAGAIVLGKTHTTEFAYRDPAPTHNPWNLDHTPGGSSAGSGAAVAARMVPLALGTQTVGSILRPAAYCGIVGFKATHGLTPADDVVPLAWSLDHVGVLARSVDDAALGLGVLADRALTVAPRGAPTLAIAPELLERAEPETAAHVRAMADAFAAAGARVVEVRLPPSFARVHEVGLTILQAETATYHAADFARHAAEFGPGIRAAIEAGLRLGAVDYVRADRARREFAAAMGPLLEGHDALLGPTAPGPAPAGLASTGDAWFCAPWSSAGVPAITLPSGLASSGLPHAVQLVGPAGGESPLLGVAAWCETVLRFTATPAI
ncbi:MAG TPA: amidase [Solirubrobacteraceae bacterium]|jgi:aspartyl-tRNA(Asn)/glutamyl-tRNA(Gln) amidotransferase subunit A